MGILVGNTGGGQLQTAAGHNSAIRKSRKVLPDVPPAIVMDMVVFHRTLPLKMVGTIKMNIGWNIGMMLLYLEYRATYSLLKQPGLKFLQSHLGKSESRFHASNFKWVML